MLSFSTSVSSKATSHFRSQPIKPTPIGNSFLFETHGTTTWGNPVRPEIQLKDKVFTRKSLTIEASSLSKGGAHAAAGTTQIILPVR